MATQETLMSLVRADVAEIKRDVKTLLRSDARSGWFQNIVKAVPWAALIAAAVAIFVK